MKSRRKRSIACGYAVAGNARPSLAAARTRRPLRPVRARAAAWAVRSSARIPQPRRETSTQMIPDRDVWAAVLMVKRYGDDAM
jgi:hypothetical protein